jgi:hypothetical protein
MYQSPQDRPIGGALGDAMNQKYGGQQLGGGAGPAKPYHQDQPIGGALGDAMKGKYGAAPQFNAGPAQGGAYHQDQPIGGALGDAMKGKYGGAQLPLFNKQMPTAGVGNGYSEPNQTVQYAGGNNFY